MPYDYNFHLQPIPIERELSLIPDELLVVGKGLKDLIKRYDSKLNVNVAPAFRFKQVHEKISAIDAETLSILVGLPNSINESFIILDMINESMEYVNENVKFIIKKHPSHDLDRFKRKEKYNFDTLNFVEGEFYYWLNKCSIYISTNSSTCIEALAFSKPVIIIQDMTDLPKTIIPTPIPPSIWAVANTSEQLSDTINIFMKYSKKEFNALSRIGWKVRKLFFEPPNRENVKKFILPF